MGYLKKDYLDFERPQSHTKVLFGEKMYWIEHNEKGIPYHALRHSFATRCIELSFDIKTLSVILGHSSVNITLNRYVHSSMDLKKANMSKLSLCV